MFKFFPNITSFTFKITDARNKENGFSEGFFIKFLQALPEDIRKVKFSGVFIESADLKGLVIDELNLKNCDINKDFCVDGGLIRKFIMDFADKEKLSDEEAKKEHYQFEH
jgi:hypothetical protein